MKINEFLFGFVEYTVDSEDVGRAAELFLKNKIAVSIKNNKFRRTLLETRKTDTLLATRVKFTKSRPFGLGGFLYEGRKKIGAILSIIICIMLLFVSSDRIWDIRVEGNGEINADAVISELAACGFSVGGSWSDSEISKVEVKMLEISNEVSWINVNRRGTVAYVSAVKKEVHEPIEDSPKYANVVAAYDGVVEEITVTRGIAAVKVGDSFKAGDVLISGVIPAESGGGFCCAEGVVIAKIFEELEVAVPDTESVKIAEEREICSVKLNFFGFSANIFKSFNTKPKNCDIIDSVKYLSFLGKKIPISASIGYLQPYTTVESKLSAKEMTDRAGEKMSALIALRVADSTLISIATDGRFSDTSYVMKSSIVYLGDVALTLPFEVVTE